MEEGKWRFNLKTILFLCFFLFPLEGFTEPSLSRSMVRLKIRVAAHDPIRPWQMQPSVFRSSQAIAVGKYELVAIASQISDHQLIQIQTVFQSDLVEAKVKIVDYDLNLCLLSVDPKTLSVPFIPVSFKNSLKIGDPIQFVWLTEDQRFLEIKGRLIHADTFFSSRSQTGFLQFVASSESFPGGYTEAVLQGNKIAGLVQSMDSDKKTSSILPASLIQSFLKKAQEIPYLGTPKAGFNFTTLSDKITRAYLKLHINRATGAQEKRGVYISDIYDFGSGSEELEKNDVLLKWGTFDVDPRGAVVLGALGKVSLWSLLGEASVGSRIPCTIWRNGTLLEIPITLKSFSSNTLPIPYQSSDAALPYFITGGYVFQELSRPFLDVFGNNWEARLDPALKKLVDKHRFHSIPGKKRIVLMTQVLPHPINQGYQHLYQKVLSRVNGISIKELKDLPTVFSQSPEYFHMELENHSTDILIPAMDLAHANLQIQQLYSVPRLSSFEEEKRG